MGLQSDYNKISIDGDGIVHCPNCHKEIWLNELTAYNKGKEYFESCSKCQKEN